MRILDNLEAKRLSRTGFGFPLDRSVSNHERSAEAMRCAVWATTRGGKEPAFSATILNRFSDLVPKSWQTQILGEDSDEESVPKEILDELLELGDVECLGRGYWLPSPLRAVRTQQHDRYILCSGRPTVLLPSSILQYLRWHGGARFVDVQTPDMGIAVQDWREWAGAAVCGASLEQWTRDSISKIELRSFDDSSESFEVYAPGVATGNLIQHKRWRLASSKIPDGVYVARQKAGPMRHYLIAKLVHGAIVASGSIPDWVEPRRLMYGMDAISDQPCRFKVTRNSVTTTVYVTSEIPKAERRLFLALGQLTIPKDRDHGYPRLWTFPNELIDQVKKTLDDLGVNVVT